MNNSGLEASVIGVDITVKLAVIHDRDQRPAAMLADVRHNWPCRRSLMPRSKTEPI